MRKGIKKRVLTGIAAIALVAPLVLSGAGMSHANAAQTATAPQVTTGANPSAASTNQTNGNNSNNNSNNSGQASNSGQLNAIKNQIQAQYSSLQTMAQPYRQKYQKLPKNDKSQQQALETQFEQQAKPIQQKILALRKEYTNTMTPEQRKQAQQKQQAAQKQMMQQLQKQFKAQQKKEQAKMLKTAQTIFIIQGKRVYTLRTDVVKNKKGQEQLQPIPGINKKYYSSLRAFGKKQSMEIQRARAIAYSARRYNNKAARTKAQRRAQKLFMQYARVASMPTKQQQKAQDKQAGKAHKKGRRKNVKKARRDRRTERIRRNHNRVRRLVRKTHRKGRNRIKRSKRRVRYTKKSRRRSSTFSVNEFGHRVTLLRSGYKRGNYQAAKRSGFIRGRNFSNGLDTMFDRYRPNSSRAVIPNNYKIYKVNVNNKNHNQRATVWLVGHRNNNIANMKQAYYYGYNSNKHYGGWRNIGV